MEAVTYKIFPTLVHKIKTRGWEKYKGYLLDTIRDTTDPEYRPTEGFYTDYGKRQVWREKIWDEFLEPQLRPLLDQTNTRLQDIWAQQYINLADHSAHQHQPVGYSCVLYAEYDPEHHWSTMLFRPFLDPNDEKNVNAVYSPQMQEGEILVFPSWMLHQAPPSKSLVPRTVIAFNLEPKYLDTK